MNDTLLSLWYHYSWGGEKKGIKNRIKVRDITRIGG